ncbi:hypothetical protein E2C01_088609 [Portunus trituberculatus]|uniref:Uncharacterized protein n=1 Tax=Portunus trituberculatus TaxID=210409 RepID=A0A5B7J9R4_PORTR|nr:hypothetical protein [Portunus trituberculatus]
MGVDSCSPTPSVGDKLQEALSLSARRKSSAGRARSGDPEKNPKEKSASPKSRVSSSRRRHVVRVSVTSGLDEFLSILSIVFTTQCSDAHSGCHLPATQLWQGVQRTLQTHGPVCCMAEGGGGGNAGWVTCCGCRGKKDSLIHGEEEEEEEEEEE